MTVLVFGDPINGDDDENRDVTKIVLPIEKYTLWEGDTGLPYTVVEAATGKQPALIRRFLLDLEASDLSANTKRAYALDLLRWCRFLDAINVSLERASRTEVRDLVRWLRQAPNPQRERGVKPSVGAPGSRNVRTGKPYLPLGYSRTTINRQLSALRTLYDFLADEHVVLVNPVPQGQRLFRSSETTSRGANAHRSPMERRSTARRAPLRQRTGKPRIRGLAPRHEDEVFDSTTCPRDWAILFLALWSGPRACEILSLEPGGLDRSRNIVWVARKGHGGALSELPVPPVWFEFVDAYLHGLRARGVHLNDDDALWRTIAGPDRPLTYESLRGIVRRLGARLGFNYTLHDFRHAAATRMAADRKNLSVVDVQTILGHASLETTGRYTTTSIDTLARAIGEHYKSQQQPEEREAHETTPDLDYDVEDLDDLLGGLS